MSIQSKPSRNHHATLTYKSASALFATARNAEGGKPLCRNTRLFKRGKDFAVQFHDTDVILIHPNNTYSLFNGGYFTVTTSDRIREYSPARIGKKNGVWYIENSKWEKVSLFYEGMKVNARGLPLKPSSVKAMVALNKLEQKTQRMIAKYVRGYLDSISAGNLDEPSNGDCFYCAMRTTSDTAPDANGIRKAKIDTATPHGVPLGDAFNDVSHLLEHMRESYFVPSLLRNAIAERGYNPAMVWPRANNQESWLVANSLRKYFRKRKAAIMEAVKAMPRADRKAG